MNVIICDDDNSFVQELKILVKPIFKAEYPETDIYCFNNGFELFNWYIQKNIPIDILFIDVEMPGYTGIEVIRKLRKEGCNCMAIFISLYKTYVFQTLDFDITNYLLKPIDEKKVTFVAKKAVLQYKSTHSFVVLNTEDRIIPISINDIICVESKLGKLIYHTVMGDYTVIKKISDAEKQLTPYNFLRTHKSYIINMDKVKYCESYMFYLIDDNFAEISHTRRANIISTYKKYLENVII